MFRTSCPDGATRKENTADRGPKIDNYKVRMTKQKEHRGQRVSEKGHKLRYEDRITEASNMRKPKVTS